jgi:hypothetical protein
MDVPDATRRAELDPHLVAEIERIELEGLLIDLRRVERLVTFLVVAAICALCMLQLG